MAADLAVHRPSTLGQSLPSPCTSLLRQHHFHLTVPKQLRRKAGARSLICKAALWRRQQNRQQQQLVEAAPPPVAEQPPALWRWGGGFAALAVVSAAIFYAVRPRSSTSESVRGLYDNDRRNQESSSSLQDPTESKEYQMALARTRQSVSVHKAVQFMNAGNPARSMVELRRALQENAIARATLLNARYDKQEMADLYRLHLQQGDVPPRYSTLLQLREMLGLEQEEAEVLEVDVLETGSAFSI